MKTVWVQAHGGSNPSASAIRQFACIQTKQTRIYPVCFCLNFWQLPCPLHPQDTEIVTLAFSAPLARYSVAPLLTNPSGRNFYYSPLWLKTCHRQLFFTRRAASAIRQFACIQTKSTRIYPDCFCLHVGLLP